MAGLPECTSPELPERMPPELPERTSPELVELAVDSNARSNLHYSLSKVSALLAQRSKNIETRSNNDDNHYSQLASPVKDEGADADVNLEKIVPDSEEGSDAGTKDYYCIVVPDSEEEDSYDSELKKKKIRQEDNKVLFSLLKLSSTEEHVFDWNKSWNETLELFMPILHPNLYGNNNDETNEAARSLFWMAKGH